MDLLGRARTLVRVVDAGSLSSAARSLGLSLAAVSRQISSLEEELGAPLLVRTTRRTSLTDAGTRFLEHARRLAREADAARASVRPDSAIGGRVVLSTSVTLGVLRVVPAMPKLLGAHSTLELELRLEERAADLVSEGVDIALRAGLVVPDTTGLVAQPVATFERTLVASPAYLRRNGTPRTSAALASHPAVLGTRSTARWEIDEDAGTRSVTVTPRLRVDTLLGIRAAVLAGLGIALLPDFVVANDLHTGALRALLPAAELRPVMAHAIYRIESRGTPRIDAIVAHLRATVPLASR